MTKLLATALTAIGIALPGIAAADNTVRIPLIRIPATVSGTWVLNPRACPDIREDVRDARRTTSIQDLREDRRDQRVVDCPTSSWTFVADPGNAPNKPIRIRRDGTAGFVERGEYDRYRQLRSGYGSGVRVQPAPVYAQPAPTYTAPVYNAPVYNAPAPTYSYPAPTPAPTYNQPYQQAPSTGGYQIINGRIVWPN